MTIWRIVGAVLGVGAGSALALAFGEGGAVMWITLAAWLAVSIVLYVIVASTSDGPSGSTGRRMLAAGNAGMNGALLVAIGVAAGDALGAVAIVVGIVAGILGFLATFDSISTSAAFQAPFGWLNWVMPMSWPIVALGFGFFVVNLLGAAVTGNQATLLAVRGLHLDAGTCTFFTVGGFVANLNTEKTAFDMGPFAFTHVDSVQNHDAHESGHTLNLAAFGSAFHLIGFVDEMIVGHGADAFSETLAEGHEPAPRTDRARTLMWH